jgi:hypothetical protein
VHCFAHRGTSIEEETRGIMTERALHVSITDSLGNLALADPYGGIWKPVDGL